MSAEKDRAEEVSFSLKPGTVNPAFEALRQARELEDRLWEQAHRNPPTEFQGFTQTIVSETAYMRDGTVVEKEILPTAVERIARIIDPAAFMPSPAHGPSIVSHAVAITKAREIVTFFNQIITESPAYKQWVARGCPK